MDKKNKERKVTLSSQWKQQILSNILQDNRQNRESQCSWNRMMGTIRNAFILVLLKGFLELLQPGLEDSQQDGELYTRYTRWLYARAPSGSGDSEVTFCHFLPFMTPLFLCTATPSLPAKFGLKLQPTVFYFNQYLNTWLPDHSFPQ